MNPDELSFEHVGTMACDDRLLICDVEYFPEQFAGMAKGAVGLDAELEVVPGTWQVVIARDGEDAIRLVILTHDRELDELAPLDEAELVAHLRVDSGRITAVDSVLRDDDDIQTAVIEAPREQVPCMLRPLSAEDETSPRGTLIDIDAGGVFELYASLERPRMALLLVIDN